MVQKTIKTVTPAKAEVQFMPHQRHKKSDKTHKMLRIFDWMPAFAGMTMMVLLSMQQPLYSLGMTKFLPSV